MDTDLLVIILLGGAATLGAYAWLAKFLNDYEDWHDGQR